MTTTAVYTHSSSHLVGPQRGAFIWKYFLLPLVMTPDCTGRDTEIKRRWGARWTDGRSWAEGRETKYESAEKGIVMVGSCI